MPTPMFKVLAQSLRLGQPPDATTAVRVLVEVIEKQQAELEDLRSKLSIATSRVQYAEARLSRLLEVVESVPQLQGQPQAPPEREQRRSEPPRGSQRPPAIPASPPIPKSPRIPSIPAPSAPILHDLVDGSGLDEFNQTLVINKRDVAQVQKPEAPFPIARASERPRAITRAEGTPFYQVQQPTQEPAAEELQAGPSSREERPREARGRDRRSRVPEEERQTPQHPAAQRVAQQRQEAQHYQAAQHQPQQHQQQQAPQQAPRGEQRRAMVSDPETQAMDIEVVQGDMTVTEQTARVALAGLAELEARQRRRDPEE